MREIVTPVSVDGRPESVADRGDQGTAFDRETAELTVLRRADAKAIDNAENGKRRSDPQCHRAMAESAAACAASTYPVKSWRLRLSRLPRTRAVSPPPRSRRASRPRRRVRRASARSPGSRAGGDPEPSPGGLEPADSEIRTGTSPLGGTPSAHSPGSGTPPRGSPRACLLSESGRLLRPSLSAGAQAEACARRCSTSFAWSTLKLSLPASGQVPSHRWNGPHRWKGLLGTHRWDSVVVEFPPTGVIPPMDHLCDGYHPCKVHGGA